MGAFIEWSPHSNLLSRGLASAGPILLSKSLYFDVITEEGQELTNTATEHPVEEGSNITDHVKRDLNKVSLEAFVSDSPIYDLNGRGGFVGPRPLNAKPKYTPPLQPTPGSVYGAIGSAIRSLVGGNHEYSAQVLQWPVGFDAVGETLKTLEEVRDKTLLVDVVLVHRRYSKMLLTSVSMLRNAGTGNGATFKLEFRELQTVQVSIVGAPKPTQIRATPKVSKGAKPAEEVDKATEKSTVLAKTVGDPLGLKRATNKAAE